MTERSTRRPPRGRALRLLCAGTLASCTSEPPSRETNGGPPASKAEPPAAGEAEATSPFRFEPTLREHAPAGAEIAPLVEISEPSAYQVRIVAAIERPGEALAIELWTYDMRNEREVLEPKGSPVPILRVRADQPRAAELAELRRRHAAPGVDVRRPQGLPGADAAAVVGRLQSAAAKVRDAASTPRARVQALVELVNGLDDTIVLERDALPETIDALASAAAVTGTEQVSERRAIATTATHRLELMRKRDGWALVAIEAR